MRHRRPYPPEPTHGCFLLTPPPWQLSSACASPPGIVPGGGTALLWASKQLVDLKKSLTNMDQRIGVEIVEKALKAPVKVSRTQAPPPTMAGQDTERRVPYIRRSCIFDALLAMRMRARGLEDMRSLLQEKGILVPLNDRPGDVKLTRTRCCPVPSLPHSRSRRTPAWRAPWWWASC